MSLNTLPIVGAPEHTTLTSYTTHRLGLYPTLLATFADTITQRQHFNVLSVVDGTATIQQVQIAPMPSVGEVLTKHGATDEFTIETISEVDGSFLVTTDPPMDATNEGNVLVRPVPNVFGVPAHVEQRRGRQWSIGLNAAIPAQREKMVAIELGILMDILSHGFALHGVTLTQAELLGYAQTMLMGDNGLDSAITRACEALETERRANPSTFIGTIHGAIPTE